MLTSKEILGRTGISRATLNNYIAAGLIPRPEVLPPGPDDGGAPRIGYFPDDTAERIETIQRLKGEGWSLGRILQSLEQKTELVAPAGPKVGGPVRVPLPAAPDGPQMLVVAVLAITLHDADSLWVGLSVHDYFALTHEVAVEVRRIVTSRGGDVTRVAPHRFVCRFLPRPRAEHLWNALDASLAIQESVQEISGRWKLRRNWDMDVVANAGVCEGESWVSALPPDDVQIVGETLDDAQQLARFARRGAVLVTRSLVARLPEERRGDLVHGVPSSDQREGAPARLMTFARLREFAPSQDLPRRIAALPVTEMVRLRAMPSAGPKEVE